jgi:2'-5' RNA ligase
MNVMRTFIAIELPVEVQGQIRLVQEQLQAHLRRLQIADCFTWTLPEKTHITLRFLGETDARQSASLAQGLAEIVYTHDSFTLCLSSVGCFPNYRAPNIIWLGIQGELDQLAKVQAPIEQLARQTGFAPETRPFSPHLTIARARRNADRSQLAQAGRDLKLLSQGDLTELSPFAVNQLVHMQSELLPGGARYTPIESFTLRSI